MAVSFRIQQDRVSLEIPACFGASSSDTTPRTPSPADKLGMKAQFMQKSKRNPAEIIEVYDKALELDGNHAANIGNYALFLCTTCSQMDQAELYFKRALDVDPANAKNLANYGNFLRCVRKDFPASEACYKRAMDAAPNDVGILGGYADLLAAKESGDAQNLEMARKLLEKALGIHPTHTRNRLRLAMVLSNLEDNEEADRCFKALLASVSQQKANDNQIKQETLVSIYGNYASFLFRRGQWARAKHLYDKAVKVDPQHPWLLRNFSCFLRESRQVLSPRGETTAL
ncbi:hypothetical protein PHYBOEH_011863 [Phytophthora boehmeriae]|uniref:Uncharacterized protein n=1 Tax=Phytophthora boehmeriae TaxID=109152 RepID=A0A8T1WXV1_9STRA|nr:hypothetical protein PHYBOEH_011863 [Phytophthora boehmeriae]